MPKRTFYGKRYHGKKARRIQAAFRGYRARRKKKKTIKRQLTSLKKIVYANQQQNWIDQFTPSTSVVSAGAIDFGNFLGLQNIAYGTNDHTDRIGDVITIKKAHLTMTIDQSTTDSYNFSRFIFGVLPEGGGAVALPSVTDILQVASVDSEYTKGGDTKWNKMKDFKVVTYLNTTLGCVKKLSITLNFKGLKVYYRPASNVILKNMPFMLAISDSAVVDHPKVRIQSRLWFSP